MSPAAPARLAIVENSNAPAIPSPVKDLLRVEKSGKVRKNDQKKDSEPSVSLAYYAVGGFLVVLFIIYRYVPSWMIAVGAGLFFAGYWTGKAYQSTQNSQGSPQKRSIRKILRPSKVNDLQEKISRLEKEKDALVLEKLGLVRAKTDLGSSHVRDLTQEQNKFSHLEAKYTKLKKEHEKLQAAQKVLIDQDGLLQKKCVKLHDKVAELSKAVSTDLLAVNEGLRKEKGDLELVVASEKNKFKELEAAMSAQKESNVALQVLLLTQKEKSEFQEKQLHVFTKRLGEVVRNLS